VTDVVMPGMSGKQATDALLTLWPGTRVIFMTGYTDNAVIHHGVLDPGATLIEKPFTLDALVRTIQRKLQGERE
jgi:FixJ family two-component response regulator